jgi:hypothetical protein
MPDLIQHPELAEFTRFRLKACRNDDVNIMRLLIGAAIDWSEPRKPAEFVADFDLSLKSKIGL